MFNELEAEEYNYIKAVVIHTMHILFKICMAMLETLQFAGELSLFYFIF